MASLARSLREPVDIVVHRLLAGALGIDDVPPSQSDRQRLGEICKGSHRRGKDSSSLCVHYTPAQLTVFVAVPMRVATFPLAPGTGDAVMNKRHKMSQDCGRASTQMQAFLYVRAKAQEVRGGLQAVLLHAQPVLTVAALRMR